MIVYIVYVCISIYNLEDGFSICQVYTFWGKYYRPSISQNITAAYLSDAITASAGYTLTWKLNFKNLQSDQKETKHFTILKCNTWHAGHIGAAGAGVQGILFSYLSKSEPILDKIWS